MLKKIITTALLTTCSIGYAKTAPIYNFGSAEHKYAGDEVKLQLAPGIVGKDKTRLTLPNGLQLSYGEIVTLAGDFYGDPDHPISLGKNNIDKHDRFMNAFNSLATNNAAVTEAPKILNVVNNEEAQLAAGIRAGESPAKVYERIATDNDVEWNCITGGMCASDYPNLSNETLHKIYYMKEGRYLRLEDRNFDHFGEDAWESYTVGHKIALDMAIDANKTQDKQKLSQAYAINAFANHYLSDAFSTGHFRTPHLKLYNTVNPATIGSLLTSYMHEEDSELGLTVTNHAGDTWVAYGDSYFFDARNKQNRMILLKAMQASADEVFYAYKYGTIPEDKVAPLMPDLNKVNTNANTAPLFYWDPRKQVMMRRVQVNNPYNYEWTDKWYGWETLSELVKTKGPLRSMQGELISHPDTAAQAILAGLIDDADILKWKMLNSTQTTYA